MTASDAHNTTHSDGAGTSPAPLHSRARLQRGAIAVGLAAIVALASTVPARTPAPGIPILSVGLPPTPQARVTVFAPTSTPPQIARSAVPQSDAPELPAALRPVAAAAALAQGDAPRYALRIDISADGRSLTGTQTTRYINRDDVALDALLLRLYPATPALGSAMAVNTVMVDGAPVPVAPVTLNGIDDLSTISDSAALSVALRAPLAPGAALTLSLAYTIAIAHNPAAGYRTFGRVGDIIALPGAYAALAPRANGTWLATATPGYGDVALSEAAWFDVEITASRAGTLVAPGVCTFDDAEAGRQRAHCVSGPQREFAFVLGPFATVTEVARLPDGDVIVESYATRYRMAGATNAAGYAVSALRAYEARFGPYPYRVLRVFESPTTVGGMEYSMLAGVTDTLYDAPDSQYFEWIVAHEVAHQWWYGQVGNDPINTPWLDESLTNFSLTFYYEDVYGLAVAQVTRQHDYYSRYALALDTYRDLPAGLPTGRYPKGSYGAFVYGKGAIFFDTVRRTVGDGAYLAWMRRYLSDQRWRIATPEDLLRAADEVGIGRVVRNAHQVWVAAR